MADPFVAEIRIFPFNFAPKGWAFCDGQLLPISQNTALFSLLGTTYGGDGKSTFALPDLQDNAAMHPGPGKGLSERFLGETGGVEFVTLAESELPFHNHNVIAQVPVADTNLATNNVLARSSVGGTTPYQPPAGVPLVPMALPQALGPNGGSLPHNNMQPFLTLSFCIAMQGVFPPRT
ncbi:MAG: hypothetical protein QOG12_294 [Verrucomicrobiota bacterium]|jgi:microcystin-dependent protein